MMFRTLKRRDCYWVADYAPVGRVMVEPARFDFQTYQPSHLRVTVWIFGICVYRKIRASQVRHVRQGISRSKAVEVEAVSVPATGTEQLMPSAPEDVREILAVWPGAWWTAPSPD